MTCASHYRSCGLSRGGAFLAVGVFLLCVTLRAELIPIKGGILPTSSDFAGQTVSDFSIGRFETTWDEWQAVRAWGASNGYSDLAGVGNGIAGNYPVRDVNWYDVVKWCNAKSEMEGLTPAYLVAGTSYRAGMMSPDLNVKANGYRLPTEAEWEWAARGGVSSQGFYYSGSNDLNSVAWYQYNSSYATWPSGRKSPNELGVYDMSGNVWEWCWDGDTFTRKIRGGSFINLPFECAVSFGGYWATAYERGWNSDLGFRVVLPDLTAPKFTGPNSFSGGVGIFFNSRITAIGSGLIYLSASNLPPGLDISIDGVISGTPTKSGNFESTLVAFSEYGISSQTATFVVAAPSPPTITSLSFAGAVGLLFSNAVTATGDAPIGYGASNLPAGLTISTNGGISGIPTAAGIYTATLVASNAYGVTSQLANFAISDGVAPRLQLSPVSGIGFAFVGVPFSRVVAATGSSPIVFGGADLPAGLTISEDGVISGMPPPTTGTYYFTLTASNAYGSTSSTARLRVRAGVLPQITSPNSFRGTLTVPFAGAITAYGSIPISFTATALPPGLTISEEGLISGVPTSVGTNSITLSASNAYGVALQSATFVVSEPLAPQIHSSEFTGVVAEAFQATLVASGTTPIDFGASSLPPGLAVSADGVISGNPAASGNYTATLTATNPFGVVSKQVVFSISKGLPVVSRWPAATWITYGEELGNSVLTGGSTSVDGAFSWKVAAERLNAGVRSARVIFTPSDSNNYVSVETDVILPVARVAPELSWPPISQIVAAATSPITLNPNLLNATSSVIGTFAYRLSNGSALALGTNKVVATFLPNDTNNYFIGRTITNVFLVVSPPAISSTSYTGDVGAPFSGSISASGSAPIYFAGSNLPPGLVVSPDGSITGTPTTAGTNTATLTASNAYGVASADVVFGISLPSPVIMSSTNYTGVVGVPFSESVSASGSAPIYFSALNLPLGLTISSDGVISGTPTTAGTNTATLTASNAYGVASEDVVFGISLPTPATITSTNYTGVVGVPFSGSVSASGSAPIYFSASNLPAGLVVSPVGAITGTPTAAGTNTATLIASNAHGVSSTPATFDVLKGVPVISSWPTVSEPPTFGLALSNSVLVGGVASVPGSFGWNAPGYLPAGRYLATKVVFIPTDAKNYDPVLSEFYWMTVRNGTPVLSWAPSPAAGLVYPAPLSSNQLNATSDVPGTFEYTPANGTVLNPGTNTLVATFTPDNTEFYYSGMTITNTVVVSGEWTWNVSNGVGQILNYYGLDTSVSVPSQVVGVPVKAIGSGSQPVFGWGNTSVVSVTLPEGVTELKQTAFRSANGLTTINVPSSVTNIEWDVFTMAEKLENINVASGNPVYSSIDGIVFDKAKKTLVAYPYGKKQSHFEIPVGVERIADAAFFLTLPLKSIGFPNTVTNVGRFAFQYCEQMTNVVLSTNIASIEQGAFSGCLALPRISLPNSLTNLGSNVFNNCYSLEQVNLSTNLAVIPAGAFEDTRLAGVVIPNSVLSIENEAFAYSRVNLSRFIFTGNAPNVEPYAFRLSSPKIYYLKGKSGWSDQLNGLPTYPFSFASSNAVYFGGASFKFSWGDTLDLPISVERSSSLVGPWQVISTNQLGGEFIDTNPLSGRGFYRAFLPY